MSTDAIAAAREVLPGWVVWSPLGSVVAGAVVCAALSAAAVAHASRPLRRLTPDAHWTERARLVRPVRRAIVFAWALALVAAAPLTVGGPLARPGQLSRWALEPLGALVAALAVAFAFENRHVRRLPWTTRWRSAAGYALLVAPAYGVSGAFAVWTLQADVSPRWALAGGAAAVLLAVAAAPWLGRVVGLVRAAPPRARGALSLAVERVGGARPPLLVLPIAGANAMAFQLTRTMGVTQGALDHLDDEELAAVLAHELGHLRERPALVLLRAAMTALLPTCVIVLPWAARQAWEEEGYEAALGLGVLAVLLVYRRLRRTLEQRADAIAVTASPMYAAALEKIYRANLEPVVVRHPGAHPSLVDRMTAAGAPPAWPPPQPPPSPLPTLIVVALLAGAVLEASSGLRAWFGHGHADRGPELALSVAVNGQAYDAGRLATWHLQRRETDAALALFRAAEVMDGSDAAWPAYVSTALSYQGRCGEALEAVTRAAARDPASPHVRAAREIAAACAQAPPR